MGLATYTYNRSTSGGEIITHLVNSSDGQGLDFANGALLQLEYAAGGVFGTSDFSIEFIIDQSSGNSNNKILYTSGGNNEFQITSETASSKIELTFDGADYDFSYDMSADYGSPVHYVMTFDRSALATLYKDGNSVATVDISGSSAVDLDNSGTAAGYLGGVSDYGVTGVFYRWRTWKKLLSAAEVTACYENASVPIADQWSNCVTDLDFAFANPEMSLQIQSRSGAGDATASVGISQITPIEQVNTNKLSVGGTTPRVGIGLAAGTAPSTELHVAGAYPANKIRSEDTTDGTYVEMHASAGSAYLASSSGHVLRLAPGGSTKMLLNSSGQVGVNTTPAGTFHTVGLAGTTAMMVVGASNNNIANFYDSSSASKLTISSTGLVTAANGIVETNGVLKENLLTNSGFDVWSNSTLENVGSELVTNGDFASASDWSTAGLGSGTWTITAGVSRATGVANGAQFYQAFTFTVGKLYKITYTISGYSAGGIYLDVPATNSPTESANGTFSYLFEADTASSYINLRTSGTTTLDIDDVSMFEVTPGCVAADALAFDGGYVKDATLDCWRQHDDGPTGTITINNGAGYAAGDYTSSGMTVDALSIALRAGQELYFSGSKLVISAAASASATTIYGTLTGATVVDDEVGYANNTKDGSFYSLKTTAGAADDYIYWPSYYNKAEHLQRFAGRTVTFGCWVKTSTASHARIRLYQEPTGGTTHVDTHTGGGNWEWLEVPLDVNAAVTTLKVQFDQLISGQTAYFSQPMLVFGSAIGSGNYSRPSGEVVWFESDPWQLNNYANASLSAADDATINLEAESNGRIPKGAAAVYCSGQGEDSAVADRVGYYLRKDSSGGDGLPLSCQVNSQRATNTGWVPADSNGDIYIDCRASGGSTLTAVDITPMGVQLR